VDRLEARRGYCVDGKEQAAQIQKVSAQMKRAKSAPQWSTILKRARLTKQQHFQISPVHHHSMAAFCFTPPDAHKLFEIATIVHSMATSPEWGGRFHSSRVPRKPKFAGRIEAPAGHHLSGAFRSSFRISFTFDKMCDASGSCSAFIAQVPRKHQYRTQRVVLGSFEDAQALMNVHSN